jgi:hypothetical protein
MDETGLMLKVRGNNKVIVATGPSPGSTPTKVPSKQPEKQKNRLLGCSATENPANTDSNMPTKFSP